MKANELTIRDLMIGDWIYLPSIMSDDKYPVQVLEIQDDCIKYYVGGKKMMVRFKDIEPIPLTPEILEKNGFEKQWQDNYEYFDDDENLNITFHPKSINYTNGAYDYIDIEKGCLTINEMPIVFVHELQHALKLCGIEKEIIL